MPEALRFGMSHNFRSLVCNNDRYIDVSKVSFRYHPALPLLFKELDFPVNCSTRATIVGPNGAGKSTLLQVSDRSRFLRS